MKIFLIFLNFYSLILDSSQDSNQNNIVFELADLTVSHKIDNELVLIEAFKTKSNDEIIRSNLIDDFGKLYWVSIGNPKLVQYSDLSYFNLSRSNDFEIRVSLLNSVSQKKLAHVAGIKYGIYIDPKQILSLKPVKFECSIEFIDVENSQLIKIFGKAKSIYSYPLKVFFQYKKNSNERKAFEKRLHQNKDLNVYCEFTSEGQSYKENTLLINAKQFNLLNLNDEIFGPRDQIYITRNQISSLAHELYQQLDIYEEYQIPEWEFDIKFIDDFINQTSEFVNKYVPIDEALAQMSSYDIYQDIKPDLIKEELSRVFMIEKRGLKNILKVNKTQNEKLKEDNESTRDLSLSGKKGIYKGELGTKYAQNKSDEWEKLNFSLDEQIKELNLYGENEIEWERIGDMIKPKNIKVSKLLKSNLKKELVFSRIRRVYTDAAFKRNITLSLKKEVYFDKYVQSLPVVMHEYDNPYIKKLNETYNYLVNYPQFNFQQGVFKTSEEMNRFCGQLKKRALADNQHQLRLTAKLTGFKNPPIILYNIKFLDDRKTKDFLYKIISEKITQIDLDFTVMVNRNRQFLKAEIEWIAIGF
ncbi:unnamed protein product [Brachionus calyciflorus]|uniref:Uncharacterized protein n=1 Tax=Brachionus calyciflorus TaxID=104777 RepID=A0A814J3R1_9BILA|nr:unnamed protein product [Brachionus calyciflorus]